MSTLVLDPHAPANPQERSVHWLARSGGEYREVERSSLLDLGPAELAERIDWP